MKTNILNKMNVKIGCWPLVVQMPGDLPLWVWGGECQAQTNLTVTFFFFFCKSPWGKTLRQRTTTHFTGTFNLIQNNNTVSNCNPLNEITGTHYRTRMLFILSMIKINRSWVVRSIPQEVKIMSIPWLRICFPFPGLGKVNVQIYCHPCISLLFTQPHTHDIPYI